ncbi:hypothetical protein D3C86_1962760 [compost metagenome]
MLKSVPTNHRWLSLGKAMRTTPPGAADTRTICGFCSISFVDMMVKSSAVISG